jgi:hypothetical protein
MFSNGYESDDQIDLLGESLELDDFQELDEIANGTQKKEKSSVAKAAFNMTKTIVGAGVFGLALVFQRAVGWDLSHIS